VQEVQDVSNGFAPEFGNTVGTVFNTITKSGTNDYHGEGGFIFRRTPFSARPKLLPAAVAVPDVNLNSYFADGGGRIVRDKLFFFGAVEHVNRDLPAPVTVPGAVIAQLGLPASYANAIPFHQDVYFYMAKADWIVNSRSRVSIRYMHHSNDSPYDNSSSIGAQYLTSQSYSFVDLTGHTWEASKSFPQCPRAQSTNYAARWTIAGSPIIGSREVAPAQVSRFLV
jgi:hypothetical protein